MTRPAPAERSDLLPPDFMDFVVVLNERGVEFVLVGGYAVAVHGVVRATGDIDFLYRMKRANVRKLLHALEQFGAPPECMDEAALLTPETIVAFGQEPLRIDLLNIIDGVTFDQVWAGASRIDVHGQPLRVIGVDELIANKRACGRPKDLQDAKKLAAQATTEAGATSKKSAGTTRGATTTRGAAKQPPRRRRRS